jgi:hypothetical protein
MNVCCIEENYEYQEIRYSNEKIHVKCVCKVCHSYIAFVKREEIDERLIKKFKSNTLI